MNYSKRPASTPTRGHHFRPTQSLPSLPTSNPLGATSSQVAKGGECTDFSPVTFPANVDITLVRLLGENTWGWTTFKPSGFRVIYPAIAAWRQNRQIVSRLLRTVFARRIFGHLCQARASLCATGIHTRRWLENSQRQKHFANRDRHTANTQTLTFDLWQIPRETKITNDKSHRWQKHSMHQMPGIFAQNFKQIGSFESSFAVKKDNHFWRKKIGFEKHKSNFLWERKFFF